MKNEKDNRRPIKCTYCGSENTVVFAVLYVTMPSKFNFELRKTDLRSKDFIVTGQNHDRTTVFCKDCNRVDK